MFENYLKIAWRNLSRNRISSFINITGLAVGMAVSVLIALWIWDELSFNKYHLNYERIAQVMQNQTFDGNVQTGAALPLPLEAEMRKSYGNDFTYIVMSSWTDKHVLSGGDKKITAAGPFMQSQAPDLFSLKMLEGVRSALTDPASIILSASTAKAIFGNADPLNQVLLMDNKSNFKVTGVYEDLPDNTTLHQLNVQFIAPWDYYLSMNIDPGTRADWSDNSWQMYVQIGDKSNMASLSGKIKRAKIDNAPGEAHLKPEIFLQPMSKWHLYSSFKNGFNVGGAISYVWLFGITGIFVLILACINFMNLSTARSEKRSKEVGLRKAIGSMRSQLVTQFYLESFMMAFFAFILSLALVSLFMPWFNEVAGKQIGVPWNNPYFWIISVVFTLFTSLIAGSYPALFLSSFLPIKVLKGNFKAGKHSAAPRKVLVVLQFTVSLLLIIGTVVVFEQIQFVKNRPVGYNREGLLTIDETNEDLHVHFEAVRNDLLKSGFIRDIAESSSPATAVENNRGDISWRGMDPSMSPDFANVRVTKGYGESVGWQFLAGRDFSPQFKTDSESVILNESAVKYMGFHNPLGEIIKMGKRNLTVIGVIKDMVMQSPYEPVKQTVFYLQPNGFSYVNIRINPRAGVHEALSKIEEVCKVYSPSVPFSFKFADTEYAHKFNSEERIGRLSAFFAVLAIFISCMGMFGMATFAAEQRTKEIGIRKVLGASSLNLWGLLSKDFMLLILISALIASPIAYLFMNNWLARYGYHTGISWWIFAVAAGGGLILTLFTVSYQSIKAAMMNPVNSLRNE